MDKETNRLLVDAGHELAEHMMENAVKSAENVDQMTNQIFTLQVASSVILATAAFNAEHQCGKDGDEFLESWFQETKRELQRIRDDKDNLELLETKDSKLQ